MISCVTLLLLLGSQAFAQIDYKRINDGKDHVKINRDRIRDSAEFIFEGNIKSNEYYRRIDDNGRSRLYSSTIINVTKVFRGNLKLGTIEIINKLDPSYILPPNIERGTLKTLEADSVHIYFCKTSIKYPYDPKYNINQVNNKQILEYFNSNNSFCTISLRDQDGLGFTGRYAFNSLGDIYRYIASFPNVKMPKLSKNDTSETRLRPNYMEGVKPDTPHGLPKAVADSINKARFRIAGEKLQHKTDSINQIKNIRYKDSIENSKKKVVQ